MGSKSKTAGFLKFVVRRYVRLMPLYLVILVIFSLGNYRDERQSIEIFSELISRALFLEVFSFKQFSTLPMAVMWTIGVEFWLSMTIPILVTFFSLRRYSYLVLFLSLSVSFLGPIILIRLEVNDVMLGNQFPRALQALLRGFLFQHLSQAQKRMLLLDFLQ